MSSSGSRLVRGPAAVLVTGAVTGVMAVLVLAGARSGGLTDGAPGPRPAAASSEARATQAPFRLLGAAALVPRTRGAGAGAVSAPARARPQTATAARDLQALIEDRAARTGIPEAAVRAYLRGELRAPAGCHLSWTTLAGIGHVESSHGSFGGSRLLESGSTSQPILGPALDGVGPVAAIPASAAGTGMHGDPVWEHAVGPMQFLPGTWRTWGVDADDDGRAQPHDIDDAALAAAGYLCVGGRDLMVEGAWKQAVLTYNHELGYVMDVYAAAETYAALGGP